MNLFESALEKKNELKDLRKQSRGMINSYCLAECDNKKSAEFKELKKEVKRYMSLKNKISIAEGRGDEDPISTLFARVNETIALLRDMGKIDKLNEYLEQLSTLTVELKDEQARVKNPISDLEDRMKDNQDEQFEIGCDLNNLRDEAEDQGICSKSRFNKLVKIIQDRNAGKEDFEDKLQEEYLLSGLINKGAEAISDLINPKEKPDADSDEG